jgi:hypothetical protein
MCHSNIKLNIYYYFFLALQPSADYGLPFLHDVLDHTQRRTTVGRTPLEE